MCVELEALGVPFTVLSFPHWVVRGKVRIAARLKAAVGVVLNSVYLALQLRRWRCGLVYTNTVTVCVGALAARLAGLPHVWHVDEFGYEDHGLSFLFGERLSMRLVGALSKRCICPSRALTVKYCKYVESYKLAVIHPSMHHWPRRRIDAGAQSVGPHAEWFRCVIVGTLIDAKGQDEAVRAVGVLKTAGVDVGLVLVGDGPASYRQRLSDLIAAYDVSDRVSFAGHLADPVGVVESADVVLMCSKCEAFGRVTAEAMLAGKAVVAAKAGAVTELIEDRVTGLLYDSGDFEDLAAKIRFLYENPGVASRLGRNAQIWANGHFTEGRYREELLRVLTPVLAGEILAAESPAE
jgi:glycosyltransferase involved in cell wall biosynthesis